MCIKMRHDKAITMMQGVKYTSHKGTHNLSLDHNLLPYSHCPECYTEELHVCTQMSELFGPDIKQTLPAPSNKVHIMSD